MGGAWLSIPPQEPGHSCRSPSLQRRRDFWVQSTVKSYLQIFFIMQHNKFCVILRSFLTSVSWSEGFNYFYNNPDVLYQQYLFKACIVHDTQQRIVFIWQSTACICDYVPMFDTPSDQQRPVRFVRIFILFHQLTCNLAIMQFDFRSRLSVEFSHYSVFIDKLEFLLCFILHFSFSMTPPAVCKFVMLTNSSRKARCCFICL